MRATQRLIARGFEAYLVGGCVRDLLLGRTAKDYDIATEARPPQVKRTFPRNCRIIGRRFKLAHLHFHDNTKILEVSTFRRTPQVENNNDDDLLITRDNEFGTAEEDALRRDFTVNALFLDPTRNCILDYTNGLVDLKARLIRTIGDPRVRFREDPVRILRAAKFAGRLGFSIEEETFAAMAETSGDLVRAAPPRLFEEILRLLRGGHALESFQLLRDVGALRSLVPVLADFLQSARHDQRVAFWHLLEALDRRIQHRVQSGRVPSSAVLLGVLLVCPVLAKAENNPGRSPSSIAEELLGPLSFSLRLPRRDAGCLKRICGVQHRFTQTDESKRFRVGGFVHGPYFDEALELFELRMLALGEPTRLVDHWHDLADRAGHTAPVDGDHEFEPAPEHEDEGVDDPTTRGHGGPDADDPGHHGPVDAADADAGDVRHSDPVGRHSDPVGRHSDPVGRHRDPAGDADDAPRDDAEEPTPGWPTTQPATAGDEEGPRRRRRRRGRRRGGRRDAGEPAPALAGDDTPRFGDHGADDAAPLRDESDQEGSALPRRSPLRADFVHPEGEPLDADPEAAIADDSDAATGDDQHPATEHGFAAEGEPGEPGHKRRRRRRRRRRGQGAVGAEDRFPTSHAPAPHGEGLDEEAQPHDVLADATIQLDPEARPPAEDERFVDEDSAPDQHRADRPQDHRSPQPDDRGGRRRRRRGRRGGKRGNGSNAPPHGDTARSPERTADPVHEVSDRPPADRGGHEREPGRQGHERDNRGGNDRKRHERGNRGGQDRNQRRPERNDPRRRSGSGAPRDVDVVPRYRDRRGKIDVIEPAALDLSAFDVELDPKRVPTFGSIVEGKNRPKKRSPRVPEDGVDDYRPPPPPGSDSGPSAPPPPPPSDTPDSFGDW